MTSSSDEDQLRFAAARNLFLVTHNVADFVSLHAKFLSEGQEHAGIILIHQQRWGAGELARRIIRLMLRFSGKGLRNRLEYLSNW